MSERRERSAQEREAARREREQRRASKEGRPGPAAPEESAGPAESAGPEESAGPVDSAGPVESAGRPNAGRQAEPVAPFEPPSPPGSPAPRERRIRITRSSPMVPSEPTHGEPPLTRPEASALRNVPLSIRGRRIPTGAGSDLLRSARARSRRAPSGADAARPGGSRPRGRPRAGRILALLALGLAFILIWFVVSLFQPFHGSGHGTITITIPAHTSAGGVGDLLERDGVISSSFFFQLRATLGGERSSLRPGTYHLKLDMSYGAALSVLTTPPPVAKVTNVTIIEGKSRRQIDALLHSQGISGSYLQASRRSPLLSPQSYGAPSGTSVLEGFLFPSTYQLREPLSASALVADQLRAFRQSFATVDLANARRHHLTPYQVLIVASMIEAEAATARDRPLVASVIYNRLSMGIALGIDATTRYATGNYTSPLTVSQLSSSSPYNTRLNKGLPPTPIDSPGLAAVQAAANPARTNYLYFVVKPCGNGEQTFTSSYAQFLADSQKYQAARAQRGGRSPAQC